MGLNAVQSYPAERVLVAALLGRPASFHELGGRVTERILSMLSGVEAGKIRFKGTNREERALLEKAAAELAGLPLRIVYCGLSRPEIG